MSGLSSPSFRRALVGLIAVAVLALTACGGNGFLSELGTPRLASPQLLSVGFKSASGAPAGIYVTWTRIDSPACQGYYLYRYTDDNRPLEPGPEDQPPFPIELRVNGGAMIPQPASGETVTFDDIFEPVIGETYYYRVTAVDDQDPPQESYPSAEDSWTVHGHTVTGLDPTSAYWGDNITLTGDTFGTYEAGTDSVRFEIIGDGTTNGDIVSWTDTEIVVTVPDLAATGPVAVIVGGTVAYADEHLTILHPSITSLDPAEGFVEQLLTINGVNFGADQNDSTVSFGAFDYTPAVTSWSDTELLLLVPPSAKRSTVTVTVGSHVSNGVEFTPRPEILGHSPATAQAGEPVTLTGRKFLGTQGRVLLDGATELAATAWVDDEITFTLAGADGEHTLTVETSEGTLGEPYAYTTVPPLAVSFSGLYSSALYVPGIEPVITVDAPADAERVELWAGGWMHDLSTEAPFDGLQIWFATMVNGSHDVTVKAYRRAVVAESETVTITVYSLVGDVNSDGLVDIADRDLLDTLRGMTEDDPGFQPWYDTDNDGEVTEADLSAIGYYWDNNIVP
jgi:hypothetical protein